MPTYLVELVSKTKTMKPVYVVDADTYEIAVDKVLEIERKHNTDYVFSKIKLINVPTIIYFDTEPFL